MKLNKFVSNFLKAKDVPNPLTVTVASAEVVKFRDEEKGERESPAVFFKEVDQGVVLSKAALSQIIEILGTDESDEWIGKKLVLYNDTNVQFKGKRVGGLRFRTAT